MKKLMQIAVLTLAALPAFGQGFVRTADRSRMPDGDSSQGAEYQEWREYQAWRAARGGQRRTESTVEYARSDSRGQQGRHNNQQVNGDLNVDVTVFTPNDNRMDQRGEVQQRQNQYQQAQSQAWAQQSYPPAQPSHHQVTYAPAPAYNHWPVPPPMPVSYCPPPVISHCPPQIVFAPPPPTPMCRPVVIRPFCGW